MAATLGQIAAGIKARLQTIDGLRVSETPHELIEPAIGENIAAEVVFESREWLSTCNYESTFGVLLSGFLVQGDWDRGFDRLRLYLDATGDRSVEAAIEGDRTLGGLEVNATVTAVGPERVVKYGTADRMVARVGVTVYH